MLECTPNFRDVAECVLALTPGLVYRSDLVAEPDPASAAAIAGCGIKPVIDLRGPRERESAPNTWFEQAGVEILPFDVARAGDTGQMAETVLQGSGAAGARAIMLGVYRQFWKGAIPALAASARRIADGDVPLLIHCAAGKDRTGFFIAMLLAALGIEEGERLADYLASSGRVHERTHAHTRRMMPNHLGHEIDEAALACITGVDRDYLDAAFETVTQQCGSVDAYLNAAGMGEAMRVRLRARLLN